MDSLIVSDYEFNIAATLVDQVFGVRVGGLFRSGCSGCKEFNVLCQVLQSMSGGYLDDKILRSGFDQSRLLEDGAIKDFEGLDQHGGFGDSKSGENSAVTAGGSRGFNGGVECDRVDNSRLDEQSTVSASSVKGAFGKKKKKIFPPCVDDIHHRIGPNYERNLANRKEKKRRKALKRGRAFGCVAGTRGNFHSCAGLDIGVNDKNDGSDVKENQESKCEPKKDDLRLSLERKWAAENELAALKAERQLAVLKANAIDAEVKKYRTAVCVATERNMVAIEKVHGQLKANGDISADDDSRVQTILSGSSGESAPLVSGVVSGTISPNSSASMAEFRAMQKKLLDLEERNDRMTRAFEKMGLSLEALEARDKSVWTDTPENHVLLDQLYPEGYGMSFDYTPDGKFTVC